MANWFPSKPPPSVEDRLRLQQAKLAAILAELSEVRASIAAKERYVEQCRREKSECEMTTCGRHPGAWRRTIPAS